MCHSVIIGLLHLIPIVISAVGFVWYLIEYGGAVFEDFGSTRFDFIVVGAGSAGAVVAHRLSEDPSINVLLIEAGGAPSFLTGIPALAAHLQLSPYDWQFETEPQENACLGMVGQRSKWPRGKMLGGSSGLNYMLYVRGNKADYDGWAAQGNPGWSYEEVLPYFKRSECNRGKYASDPIFHSTTGPLPVEDSKFVSPLVAAYEAMANENQFETRDYNGEDQEGFDVPQVTLDHGWRADTYRTFLKDAHGRPNLHVMKHAQVHKILINTTTNEAYGVVLDRFGTLHTFLCDREVILSAGTIGSPFVLMHSGIGPKEELQKHGIDVIHDLPAVGQHLQDHLTTMVGPFFVNEPITFDIVRSFKPEVFYEFFAKGKGPLSATVACDMIAFLRRNSSAPDFEYHLTGVTITSDYGTFFHKSFGIRPELWDDFFQPFYGLDAATVLPVINRPLSRGTVTLRSADPNDKPRIDPKYLSHPDDVQNLVAAIQTIRGLLNSSEEVKRYNFSLPTRPLPGCESLPLFSDSYWECYVRHFTLTMYHPVGTCRMGPDPSSSVVDPRLRVHGIRRLRVVDGSVMPEIVSGNTHAPIVMIAEKATEMIKEDMEVINEDLEVVKEDMDESKQGKEEL